MSDTFEMGNISSFYHQLHASMRCVMAQLFMRNIVQIKWDYALENHAHTRKKHVALLGMVGVEQGLLLIVFI